MHARPAFCLSFVARFGLVLTLLPILLHVPETQGQVPRLISHQGIMLGADGAPLSGMRSVTFSIHDAAEGGMVLWTESHADVEFTAGVFHVSLGSIEPLTLPFDAPYFLGISVDDGAPLVPRLPLTSAPYGFAARSVVGETNVFPSDGNVGIGTGAAAAKASVAAAPQAKLDVEGDLRIADVPQAISPLKALVMESDNQIVKFTPIDDLVGGGGGAFSLPFAGTVNVVEAAFSVTNEGGTAIQGSSATTGVSGDSDTGVGVLGSTADGTAVSGLANSGVGVHGKSISGDGVAGTSDDGTGIAGTSASGVGVHGNSISSDGVAGTSDDGTGVAGTSAGGTGVSGASNSGPGMEGTSSSGAGVVGVSGSEAGVKGTSDSGPGLEGTSTSAEGVSGVSDTGVGVMGQSNSAVNAAVHGKNDASGIGVLGETNSAANAAVFGSNDLGVGVLGISDAAVGVRGESSSAEEAAVWGINDPGIGVLGSSDTGTGVFGETGGNDNAAVHGLNSKEGPGVYGESVGGSGVFGYSPDIVGVKGTSDSGTGIEAFGDPAGTIHGKLEIRSDLAVSRKSDLFIESLETTEENRVMVWSADQFVRYKTLDESGFDGVLNNAAFVIKDGDGNETTRINSNGTSFHAGVQTFSGGIALDGAGVGITFNDGTTQTTGFTLPFKGETTAVIPAFEVFNRDGWGILGESEHGHGVAGFTRDLLSAGVAGSGRGGAAGVRGASIEGNGVEGLSQSGPGLFGRGDPAAQLNGTVRIESDGDNGRPSRLFIQTLESTEDDRVMIWSADQFVRYKTLGDVVFDGTLDDKAFVIKNAAGVETTRINTDGTSTHAGRETFRDGVTVETIGMDAFNVGVQTTEFGTSVGALASFMRIGNTGGAGIGAGILELVVDPNTGGVLMKDRNNETFVQADASSKALFVDNLFVTGTLEKPAGSFKIDHPLDPENKYLYHSFVESPDMMNVYNGNVVLDVEGEAVIDLPEWFETLNRDFRYQLTALGGPGPGLYVAEEITGNRFRIAGGTPELKVSWQVTGVRQDPFAEQHRIQVEVEKPDGERGTYLHPEVYGLPASRTLMPMGADARQARGMR